uniref:Uncharacterized protein n=1 Tax=Candidatus Kentrum sp. FW TaxID=2126338 RepID=A0A450RTE6_9GAMM|nr:MAG: hypothetical protein BECKFW1821A_GA0114235_1001119 [Candidatus Kentron sp. FW]
MLSGVARSPLGRPAPARLFSPLPGKSSARSTRNFEQGWLGSSKASPRKWRYPLGARFARPQPHTFGQPFWFRLAGLGVTSSIGVWPLSGRIVFDFLFSVYVFPSVTDVLQRPSRPSSLRPPSRSFPENPPLSSPQSPVLRPWQASNPVYPRSRGNWSLRIRYC